MILSIKSANFKDDFQEYGIEVEEVLTLFEVIGIKSERHICILEHS